MPFFKSVKSFLFSLLFSAIGFFAASVIILSPVLPGTKSVNINEGYSPEPPEDTCVTLCVSHDNGDWSFGVVRISYNDNKAECCFVPSCTLLPKAQSTLSLLAQRGNFSEIAIGMADFLGCSQGRYVVLTGKNCADLIDNCQGIIYTNSKEVSFEYNGAALSIPAGNHYASGYDLVKLIKSRNTEFAVLETASSMLTAFIRREISQNDFDDFFRQFSSFFDNMTTDISYTGLVEVRDHLSFLGSAGEVTELSVNGYLTAKNGSTVFVLTS